MEKIKPKIFIWDLEFRGSQNWRGDLKIYPGYIICFSCKELDRPGILTYSMRTHPGKNATDDRALVKAIGEKLQEADMHIYQYGNKVDFKFIQTRLLHYGFPALPQPPMVVDTQVVASRNLGLKSNSLSALAEFFHLAEMKMPITEHEWYLAFTGDKKIMRKIETRCASDVRLTEEVYKKLLPVCTNHPHIARINKMARYVAKYKTACPKCGGHDFKAEGLRATKISVYRRLYCKGCGAPTHEVVKPMNGRNPKDKD